MAGMKIKRAIALAAEGAVNAAGELAESAHTLAEDVRAEVVALNERVKALETAIAELRANNPR